MPDFVSSIWIRSHLGTLEIWLVQATVWLLQPGITCKSRHMSCAGIAGRCWNYYSIELSGRHSVPLFVPQTSDLVACLDTQGNSQVCMLVGRLASGVPCT